MTRVYPLKSLQMPQPKTWEPLSLMFYLTSRKDLIAFTSHALTSTSKKNYAQIDKEALELVFSVKKSFISTSTGEDLLYSPITSRFSQSLDLSEEFFHLPLPDCKGQLSLCQHTLMILYSNLHKPILMLMLCLTYHCLRLLLLHWSY